jgi:hypothetical protein
MSQATRYSLLPTLDFESAAAAAASRAAKGILKARTAIRKEDLFS